MSSTPENSDPYVLQEHLNGVLKRRERRFGRRLSLSLATEHQFTRKFIVTRKFIALPPLRFERLARRLAGELPTTLRAFPPFDEIISRAVVPRIACACFLERHEAPDAARLPNLLDDPNAFLRCHMQPLGVCFCRIYRHQEPIMTFKLMSAWMLLNSGGEGGIRTPGRL